MEEKIQQKTKEISLLIEKVSGEIKKRFEGMEEVEKFSIGKSLRSFCGDEGQSIRVNVSRDWGIIGYFNFSLQHGKWETSDPLYIVNGPIDHSYGGAMLYFSLKKLEIFPFLESFGVEGWEKVAQKIELLVVESAALFRKEYTRITGGKFNYTNEVEDVIKAVMTSKDMEQLRSNLEAKIKENSSLTSDVAGLRKQVFDLSAELGELRRERQTTEAIVRSMADTLTVQAKLDLANLKLVVQKAIADLAATKGISKSRRFAEIRNDLEAAINPPPGIEDYPDDSEG